jgi:GH35 family endo-1,4-beta-xylanase
VWELFVVDDQHSLDSVRTGRGPGRELEVGFDLKRPAVALIDLRAE